MSQSEPPSHRPCMAGPARSWRSIATVMKPSRAPVARQLPRTVSSRRHSDEVGLAAGHILLERLVYRGLHRRRLIGGEKLFPEVARPLGGCPRSVFLPGLEIPPVGDHRLIE